MTTREISKINEPYYNRWIVNHLAAGQSRLVIKDNDNKAYESGFAHFLMDHYNWHNTLNSFVVFLTLPKSEGIRTPAECEKVYEANLAVKYTRTSIF